MISLEIYKLLHLTGIVLVLTGLVALLALKISGVAIEGANKKFAFLTHGLGLVLVLVSGFGLLARLGLIQTGFPGWAYVKLAIWLYFGGIMALIKRRGHLGWKLYLPLILVFMVAASVALYKPF